MAESKLASETMEQVVEQLARELLTALHGIRPFDIVEMDYSRDALRAAYLAGQQAERERCAKIAETWSVPEHNIREKIAAAIRRGE